MADRKIINIREFSIYPGGRLRAHGPNSGEQFREEYLRPALEECGAITVDLREAKVILPSFMDEAFGPLVEEQGKEFAERVQVIVIPGSNMDFNFQETVRLRSVK